MTKRNDMPQTVVDESVQPSISPDVDILALNSFDQPKGEPKAQENNGETSPNIFLMTIRDIQVACHGLTGERRNQVLKEKAKEHLPELKFKESLPLVKRLLDDRQNEFVPEYIDPATGMFKMSDLIKEVNAYIAERVVVGDVERLVLSYFVVMTWFMGQLEKVPYLYIKSAFYGSGKSTLSRVLGNLVYNSLMAAGVSAASASYLTDAYDCTLIVDEMDSWERKKVAEISSILNAGSMRGSTRIAMSDSHGSERYAMVYQSFGPKILVGTQGRYLQDATVSRCIIVNLKPSRERRKRVIAFDRDETARHIRRRLAAIAIQYKKRFEDTEHAIQYDSTVQQRTFDKFEPLFRLARLVDDERIAAQGWASVESDLTLLQNYMQESVRAGEFSDTNRMFGASVSEAINRHFMQPWLSVRGDLRNHQGKDYGRVTHEPVVIERYSPKRTPSGDGYSCVKVATLWKGVGAEPGVHIAELYALVMSDEDCSLCREEDTMDFSEFSRHSHRLFGTPKTNGKIRLLYLRTIDEGLRKNLEGLQLAPEFFRL